MIASNCPPLRKSEIEYYAMLAKTAVHHYSGSAHAMLLTFALRPCLWAPRVAALLPPALPPHARLWGPVRAARKQLFRKRFGFSPGAAPYLVAAGVFDGGLTTTPRHLSCTYHARRMHSAW